MQICMEKNINVKNVKECVQKVNIYIYIYTYIYIKNYKVTSNRNVNKGKNKQTKKKYKNNIYANIQKYVYKISIYKHENNKYIEM